MSEDSTITGAGGMSALDTGRSDPQGDGLRGSATDSGRTAYEARFADARPREFDLWDSLPSEVKAIWARAKVAVLVAAGSDMQPSQTQKTADVSDEPPGVATAAIVPSIVAGETFVIIQDEHVQLL